MCVFVVPWNGQALLRMSDTAALNIINLNIDSIQEIRNCKEKTEGRKLMLLLRTAQTRTHIVQPNEMTSVNNTKAKQTN